LRAEGAGGMRRMRWICGHEKWISHDAYGDITMIEPGMGMDG
jgi:hypothetical protein